MADEEKIAALVKRNEELRKELIGLNNELNEKLKVRGEHLVATGHVGPKIETANRLYDSPAIRENDKLKRDNAKLLRRLRENPGVQEIQILKDSLAEKEQQVNDLKLQNETLEQVTKHQGQGMAQVVRLEQELDEMQRKHGAEMLKLKEELRVERAARDEAQKQVTANQAKMSALKARISVAKSPLAEKWASMDKMKEDLEKKEEQLKALNTAIEEARKDVDNDLRTLRKEHREQAATITSLQNEIAETKQKISETDKILQMSSSPYLWKFTQQNTPQ
eukprot:TRINITY_DN33637_c0_g1_i1.p2 TRINITY_DN33637_c0_g1~~TRINITY_DN33637_c0_g1_i1.p2  ORF type:complete len:298 (+),score=155.62 TRINITY_DN33637_c0_g1_i1:63-896(+)